MGGSAGSGPRAPAERLVPLDALRGFAVLGILVVNIGFFAFPAESWRVEQSSLAAGVANTVAALLVSVFFESKFITLFSLLFGIGVALQMEAGASGTRLLRRFAVLGVVGLLHGLLLWQGDILSTYAVGGVCLLAFRRASGRVLVVLGGLLLLALLPWGAFLWFVSALHDHEVARTFTEPYAAAWSDPPVAREVWSAFWEDHPGAWMQMSRLGYGEGPLGLTLLVRGVDFAMGFLLASLMYVGWRSLGLFLVGMGLWRLGALRPGDRRRMRRVRNLGFAVGIPLELLALALLQPGGDGPGPAVVVGSLLDELGNLTLAAGYLGAIWCWSASPVGGVSPLRRGLAATGRMALTNYLGQSLVVSTAVCWYGLGLYDRLQLWHWIAATPVLFALQMLGSAWWLRRFTWGPAEWAWRCLTYERRLPLERSAAT